MKRILVLILAAGLGALMLGTWLLLTILQPSTRVIVLQPPIQIATPKTASNFVLHKEPKPLPELVFQNGNGKQIRLADFRGKMVLLNIWATWCGPCRREMPTLDRLQMKLGGPNFVVVALSIDRAGLDPVRDFYREIGIKNLDLYINSLGKTSSMLGIVGLPTTLLINREGLEVGRLVGPAEWDTPNMVAFLKNHLPNPSNQTRQERPK